MSKQLIRNSVENGTTTHIPLWLIDEMGDNERLEERRNAIKDKRKEDEWLYERRWIEKPDWYQDNEYKGSRGTAEIISYILEEKFELERKIRCYREDEQTIGSPTRYRLEKEYQLENLEERLQNYMKNYLGGN